MECWARSPFLGKRVSQLQMDAYSQFVRAAEAKDETEITRLIREHPNLHSISGDDGSLLDILRYNCPELFAIAFAAGLGPDSGPPLPHHTLLQHAVSDNHVELARLCLRHGADVERRNCEGETALGYAVSWGSLDTVRLLIEAGADVNAIEGTRENFYSTALDACSSHTDNDRSEIREYLRSHGAKRYSELSTPSPD